MEWQRRQIAEDNLPLFKEVEQIKEHSIIINKQPLMTPIVSVDTNIFVKDILIPPILGFDDNHTIDICTVIDRRNSNTTIPILRRSLRALERENRGIATCARSQVNFDTATLPSVCKQQSIELATELKLWDTDLLTLNSYKDVEIRLSGSSATGPIWISAEPKTLDRHFLQNLGGFGRDSV